MRSDSLDIARSVPSPGHRAEDEAEHRVGERVPPVRDSGGPGAFYRAFGWSLRPEVSPLLMSASSIVVPLSAVSLRRAKI